MPIDPDTQAALTALEGELQELEELIAAEGNKGHQGIPGKTPPPPPTVEFADIWNGWDSYQPYDIVMEPESQNFWLNIWETPVKTQGPWARTIPANLTNQHAGEGWTKFLERFTEQYPTTAADTASELISKGRIVNPAKGWVGATLKPTDYRIVPEAAKAEEPERFLPIHLWQMNIELSEAERKEIKEKEEEPTFTITLPAGYLQLLANELTLSPTQLHAFAVDEHGGQTLLKAGANTLVLPAAGTQFTYWIMLTPGEGEIEKRLIWRDLFTNCCVYLFKWTSITRLEEYGEEAPLEENKPNFSPSSSSLEGGRWIPLLTEPEKPT